MKRDSGSFSRYGIFRDTYRYLPSRIRKKFVLLISAQIANAFMDLLGVALVGILTALSIQSTEIGARGNRVNLFLEIVNLENFSLNIQLIILGMLAGLVFTIKTLLSIFFMRETLKLLSDQSAIRTSTLLEKILSKNLSFVESKSAQETLYILTDGVRSLYISTTSTYISVLVDFVSLVFIVIALFFVDINMALMTITLFLVVVFLLHISLKNKATNLGNRIRKLSIEHNEKILEVLNSYRELSVQSRLPYYVDKIKQNQKESGKVLVESNFIPYIGKYIIEATAILGILFLLILQFQSQTATYAVANLAIFAAASSRVMPSALRIQQGLLTLKQNSGLASTTIKLINEIGFVESRFKKSYLPDMKYIDFIPSVKLENVCFEYPGNSKLSISELNLDIRSGSSVAFIGPSGSGKTTILDLVSGVLEPDKGSIRISGLNPSEASSRWPGAISYLPQNVQIINGTLRENISLGYPIDFFSSKAIIDSLADSNIILSNNGDFNFEKVLHEDGKSISGGEKQRLGLARALLTKPKLLILDEPTSSLDGENEKIISEFLSTIKGKTTVIVVAHRLATVKNVDVIHYIENGSIRASGSFEEIRILVPEINKYIENMD
jgi:ABC-type bacteriocin/lantibiotic exporter with double-glycine peptidase domain